MLFVLLRAFSHVCVTSQGARGSICSAANGSVSLPWCKRSVASDVFKRGSQHHQGSSWYDGCVRSICITMPIIVLLLEQTKDYTTTLYLGSSRALLTFVEVPRRLGSVQRGVEADGRTTNLVSHGRVRHFYNNSVWKIVWSAPHWSGEWRCMASCFSS